MKTTLQEKQLQEIDKKIIIIYIGILLMSQEQQPQQVEVNSFNDLGLCEEMLLACQGLGYKKPTKIQTQSLPYTLKGRDIIALAQTGSGKTLAFALPILQSLLDKPTPFYGLILAPARQLVVQIADHFRALGAKIGLKVAVIIGNMDLKSQVKVLNSNPHIVVGTPGKILYHMQNTKSFTYANTRYLVMDQADKLLGDDFAGQVDKIVQSLPNNRHTFLFSATMTNKVEKLQRAALKNPVKVTVSSKYQTVDTLKQEYLFFPAKFKDIYLAYIMEQRLENEIIIFTLTCLNALKVCLFLRKLGYRAVTINGQMSQNKRLGSLARFKQKDANVLVATDVASRGLDIPSVDLVINYDLPMNPKDYIHRVGRTARAGKAGRAISFITQYDVQQIQKIQHLIGKKLDQYQPRTGDKQSIQSKILSMQEDVDQKMRIAQEELKMKLEKKEITEEQMEEKYAKFGKKIQKKKFKNKKKRTVIDI